jgi:hypothetical protein
VHGHLIGSSFSNANRNPDKARVNNVVKAPLEDGNSEEHWYVGEVEYFFAHSFGPRTWMLAYVHFYEESTLDSLNLERVTKKTTAEFIDARQIDRLVGLTPLHNFMYVLDIEACNKVPQS